MLENLIYFIYRLQKHEMILCGIIAAATWIFLGIFLPKKFFKYLNLILTVTGLFAIFYVTIIRRHTGEHYLLLAPFISFKRAKLNEEFYRTMILNCLMFIPFSLGLAGILPDKIKIGKRMLIVIISGLILSIVIETLQYTFSLGNTEIDDVIMNTLGSAIAACLFLIQNNMKKLKSNQLKAGD